MGVQTSNLLFDRIPILCCVSVERQKMKAKQHFAVFHKIIFQKNYSDLLYDN